MSSEGRTGANQVRELLWKIHRQLECGCARAKAEERHKKESENRFKRNVCITWRCLAIGRNKFFKCTQSTVNRSKIVADCDWNTITYPILLIVSKIFIQFILIGLNLVSRVTGWSDLFRRKTRSLLNLLKRVQFTTDDATHTYCCCLAALAADSAWGRKGFGQIGRFDDFNRSSWNGIHESYCSTFVISIFPDF